jgi:hypothetical protein
MRDPIRIGTVRLKYLSDITVIHFALFCGVTRYVALTMRGHLGRRTEPPPMPHNSHQRSGSGEVPVWSDRQTLPNWVFSGLPVGINRGSIVTQPITAQFPERDMH